MNFQALKWMVDSVIEWYMCPECEVNVWEENIEIIWTAGTNVNLEVFCPKCWKSTIIKGQVFNIDLSKLWIKWEKIEEKKWKTKNKNSIDEKEILDLNKTLKSKNFSMSDFFEKEEKKNKKK